jgi:hypothetical protein
MTLSNFGRIFLGVALLAIVAPSLALAAYNDVSLTTATIISVGGYTLNVSGSSAVLQSIVVNGGSFSVTLASGSSITVTSPTFQQLSSDVTSDVTSNTCTGSASSLSLAYSGGGTVTNVVTPSATVCATPAPTPTAASGGGGVISGPLSVGYQTPTPTTTPAVRAGTSSAGIPAASTSTATAHTAHTTASHFAHNLQFLDREADVRQLQEFLNTHGARVTDAGGGAPGNETNFFGLLTYAALVRFQNAHPAQILAPLNLSKGTGFFGAVTRQYVNSLVGASGVSQAHTIN